MANAYAKNAENATLTCRAIEVRRHGPSSLLLTLGFVFLVLVTPLGAVFLGIEGVVLGLLGAVAAFVQAAQTKLRSVEGGSIVLRDGNLRVVLGAGDVLRLPFTDIESGYEGATDGSAVLVLRSGREVHLFLDGEAPSRVLSHAGVATTQRVLTMPLRRALGAFTIGFATFAASLLGGGVLLSPVAKAIGSGSLALLLSLALVITALVVLRFGFPRVVVGTDGVRVLGVWRARFVPYDAVADVRLREGTAGGGARWIELTLHEGGSLTLPTVAAPFDRLQALVRRIEQAASLHAAGPRRSFEALSRAGRSAETWREEIHRLALAPGGFRAQALDRDDFERVLDDAAAPPDHRIGAALALVAMDPEAAPARIRVAAQASADDALREALALAADGEIDDAAFERAGSRKTMR